MDLLQQLDSAGAGGQQLLADDESARLSVDWQLVEEELRDVPEEYKEPKFYPLKHVVEIFSSGDPQLQTVEVSPLSAAVWRGTPVACRRSLLARRWHEGQ